MNFLTLALVVLLVGYLIARRFGGQPLRAQNLVLPLAITVFGGYQLRGHHLGPADLAFLAVEALLALAVGAARGATIHLYVRDGHLWQRYRWATLGVWVIAIALRVGLVAGGHLVGVSVATSSILLVLGISLIGEALIVAQRARRTGTLFAPDRRQRVKV
jgi:hypothetical protein